MILSKDELQALESCMMLTSTSNQVQIESDNGIKLKDLHQKVHEELFKRQWD